MEKKKSPQQLWNERNREKTRLYCARTRQKKKGINQIEIVVEKPKKLENKLFKVLDVLRKDTQHYLWNKSVYNWNNTDWINYNILKNL